jgi:hypothetical protein
MLFCRGPANSVKITENPWLKMQKTAKKCKNSYVFDKKRGSKTSTLVENVRQINLFMQNKPNFPHFSLENDDFDKKQTQFKPNSNPILGQFQGLAKPNKPNSNPILPSIGAHLLWSLPSGVLTCCSAGGRGSNPIAKRSK